MANYQTRFSFSFSVNEKAGEIIRQGLEYFGGNEEAEFGPEWLEEFGGYTPEQWADTESGETNTGCEYEVEHKDGQAIFSVWADAHGSVELAAAIIVTGLQAGGDDTVVTFEYAFTCDKPQLDAFGGGACAIHKSGYLARGTNAVAELLAKEVVM